MPQDMNALFEAMMLSENDKEVCRENWVCLMDIAATWPELLNVDVSAMNLLSGERKHLSDVAAWKFAVLAKYLYNQGIGNENIEVEDLDFEDFAKFYEMEYNFHQRLRGVTLSEQDCRFSAADRHGRN